MLYLIVFIIIAGFLGMAIRSHLKDRIPKSTSPSALLINLKQNVGCSDSVPTARRTNSGSWSPGNSSGSDSISGSPSPSEEYVEYDNCLPTGPSSANSISEEDLKELLIKFIKKC